jgi:hypothetical protein
MVFCTVTLPPGEDQLHGPHVDMGYWEVGAAWWISTGKPL